MATMDMATETDKTARGLHRQPESSAIPVLAEEPELQAGALASLRDLERSPSERRRLYVNLHLKLALVIAASLAWAGFSLWLSIPWIESLGQAITMPLAIAVIFGIALDPRLSQCNLIASLLSTVLRRFASTSISLR